MQADGVSQPADGVLEATRDRRPKAEHYCGALAETRKSGEHRHFSPLPPLSIMMIQLLQAKPDKQQLGR